MENNQQKATGTTFLLVRPNGEVLLQLRDEKTRYYPNTWCFPGETSEGEEKAISAVIRGIKEEYDLEVVEDACQFFAMNSLPHISQEVAVFICRVKEDQTPKLKEGKEMRWMSLGEIKKLELGFEQNKLLPRLEEKLR